MYILTLLLVQEKHHSTKYRSKMKTIFFSKRKRPTPAQANQTKPPIIIIIIIIVRTPIHPFFVQPFHVSSAPCRR